MISRRQKICYKPINHKGMTLLEIMLAIAVLSLVVSIVTVTLSGNMNVLDSTRRQGELFNKAQVAFQRITEDLSSTVSTEDLMFVGKSLELSGQPADYLYFTTMSHIVFDEENDHSGVGVVIYNVKSSSQDQQELLLFRSDNLLLPGDEDESSSTEEKGFLLCDQLRSVRFSYVDKDGGQQDSWDTVSDEEEGDRQQNLPVAVDCTLEFWLDRDQETTLTFSTRILIPSGLITVSSL